MEKKFWIEKWDSNQIAFHQETINHWLQTKWEESIPMAQGKTVLVPLCGKSHDMLFLAELGYHVIGVELSSKAIKDFFKDNKISYEKVIEQRHTFYKSKNITLVCADIFQLSKEFLGEIYAVYDRASLIALAPDTRNKYVQWLSHLGADYIFYVGLEFDNKEIGPPFSITKDEALKYFSDYEVLSTQKNQVKDIGVHIGSISEQFDYYVIFRRK